MVCDERNVRTTFQKWYGGRLKETNRKGNWGKSLRDGGRRNEQQTQGLHEENSQ